jgi:multiple sugar transport system substrate-binding protein
MEPDEAGRFFEGASTTRRQLLLQAGASGAALTGVSWLIACSDDDDGDGKTTTVEFWDEVWGGDEYGPTVKAMIAEYERTHPNVKIKYRVIPWENFFEVYNTAIVSGTTPDIAVAPTFPWKGSLASPTAVIDKWKKNGTYEDMIPASITDQEDGDGNVTGLPWGTEMRVLTYREDLFEKAGVAVPTTLEELGEAARALSGNGRYGLGFTSETLGSQMLVAFLLNNGGGLFDDECGPALQSDRNVEVCEWIQSMVRDGAIPKAAGGWTPDDLNGAMNSGDIAMAHNATGWYAALDPEVAERSQIMPPPSGFHGDKGTIVWYLPVWTFESSSNKEAAADFLDWFLGHLPQLFRKGEVTALPARRSFYDKVPSYRDPRIKTALDDWVPVAKPLAGSCNADLLYLLNKVEGQGFLQTLTQDILTLKAVDQSLQTAQDALTEIVSSG